MKTFQFYIHIFLYYEIGALAFSQHNQISCYSNFIMFYVCFVLKKTGTWLLKAPNVLLYYLVSIKSLLSTTLLFCTIILFFITIK